MLIGTGPVGDGKGMALFIPAGYLTVDPNKYDVAGEIVKQVLTYKQSRFGGDVGTTQPANSSALERSSRSSVSAIGVQHNKYPGCLIL